MLKLLSINKNKEINENIINLDFAFNFNNPVFNIIGTKNDEIVAIFCYNNHYLKFIDINNKNSKMTFENISIIGINSLCLFQNKFLIIGGSYMITVINIFNYTKEIIDTNSWKIYSIINFFSKEKYILYADDDSNIYIWELIIGENSEVNLKKISHYNLCGSSSIFSPIFDEKSKLLITGGSHFNVNILKYYPLNRILI